ncbi:MAG TPA: CBS domain-containing protein [Anaerolineae bacterium]|nr:CBS domain-containing protein [Anaerolineae bacterium]HOQ99753.1 CBS domain-containing protein [Anaerolineae bacterium]HPL30377.1 CBS domain-containing protein [Anaerolineae bacterium]
MAEGAKGDQPAAAGKPSISKSQELVYELKIGDIMTRDPIVVGPDCRMSELKEILRVKRISGVPVVEAGRLVGIISIEDLILALERGLTGARVGEHMTRQVQVVYADESVIQAVTKFARFGYGRLPVVDRAGHMVGIVTQGDVVRGLLRQLDVQWQEEEIHRYRASHIFEDIESDQTGLVLRYRVAARDFVRGGEASSKLKRALERLGAPPPVVRRVAVAAYEAETNLIIHTDSGGELIAEVQPDRIRVVALDTGPGIADIDRAMQPGFSTAPDWIRELGFGAGMGLNNIRACADEMSIESQLGTGTRLEVIFHLAMERKKEAA